MRLQLVLRLDSAVCAPMNGFALAVEMSGPEQKIVDTLRDAFGVTGRGFEALRGLRCAEDVLLAGAEPPP
jgi:hypothetical protein